MNKYKIRSMIFYLVFSLIACSGSDELKEDNDIFPTPEVGSGETDGFYLAWEDLFNEPALNTAKWLIEENGSGGGNQELQYYRAENVSMGKEPATGKGCLILTARKESYMGKKATSGRINTSGKYEFTHGKVEASIKLPLTANGLWPAFWLLGADYVTNPWPRCGEIDILEMGHVTGIRNNTQDRYFNGACHWGYYEGTGYPNYAKHSVAPYSLQDDFHLYTLIWDDNSIKMYLDLDKNSNAAPYYAMDIKDTSAGTSPGNYLHKNFFILFNLAVGGNFPGIWDINNITGLNRGDVHMYVDYVRVYQKLK